jgi:hexokinase
VKVAIPGEGCGHMLEKSILEAVIHNAATLVIVTCAAIYVSIDKSIKQGQLAIQWVGCFY